MEGTPKQEKPQITEQIPLVGMEVPSESEGYDREAVREDAGKQLQEMLAAIEIAADVPVGCEYVARLEQLLSDLDTEDYNNEDRHVARLAEETLAKELGNMSQRNFILYKNYKANGSSMTQAA